MDVPNIPPDSSRQHKATSGSQHADLHIDKKQLVDDINQTINNIKQALDQLRAGDNSSELLNTIGGLQKRAKELMVAARGVMG